MAGSDDYRRLHNASPVVDDSYAPPVRIGRMNQGITIQEIWGRKWNRSFKTTLAAIILTFASVVSVATWYYVIGQSGDGESGMGISLVPTQIDTVAEAPPKRVDQTATEWYAPGEIKPTSKDPSLPRTFIWPMDDMNFLRNLSRNSAALQDKWGRTHKRTVMWLRRNVYDTLDEGKMYSVIDQKMTPRSGTKKDYQSMGFYWWPCQKAKEVCGLDVPEFYKKTCDAKTGMPWVLCDGKDNDQTRDYSSKNSMQLMTWDVTELALLYWYTDDESYAKRARELLRYFFLDPATAMTPHLEYAQWVPGLEEFDEVNGYGIIEVKDWSEMLDAVAILRQSQHWDMEKDDKPLMEWFRRLLAWMLASHKGNLERHHHNNHAVWFYQTALSIALHVGDVLTARMLAYDVGGMIDHQIMRDGTLPLELERPRKIHYTCYAMTAFFRVARLTAAVGVDSFNHLSATFEPRVSPVSWNHMKESIKFVIKYMAKKEKFPLPDTDVQRGNKGGIWHRCLEPIAIAQTAYPEDDELQRDLAEAIRVRLGDYWIEPRVYGQPVFATYDMFRPPLLSAIADDPGDSRGGGPD